MFDSPIFDVLALVGIGVFLYWRSRSVAASRQEDRDRMPEDERRIILRAITRPPFTDVLTPKQIEALRWRIINSGLTLGDIAHDESTSVPDEAAAPAALPTPAFDPTLLPAKSPLKASPTGTETSPVAASAPQSVTQQAAPLPTDPADAPSIAPAPPRARRATNHDLDSIRPNWDPALIILYLGALLVVIAGMIFATYNWGSLGPWQKLGLLAAGTIAFLAAGKVLDRSERIRPAARTFLMVGAMLVPVNALAAYTVFDQPDPALPMLLGALATMVVHGAIASQPGSGVFGYTASLAAVLAITAIPGAIGLPLGWGVPLALAAVSIPPDPFGRLDRFRHPWSRVAAGMAVPLAAFGILSGTDGTDWLIVATMITFSMAITRVGQRSVEWGRLLSYAADAVLIVASMQIADTLAGQDWVLPAALFAASMASLRHSRRDPESMPQFEFAAGAFLAAFAAELTRQWWDDTWMSAVFFGLITILSLGHSLRWPRLRRTTEGIAAIALPLTVWFAVSFGDRNGWPMVASMGTFTFSLVIYGYRHPSMRGGAYGFATFTAILTVLEAALVANLESQNQLIGIIGATGLVYTLVANLTPAGMQLPRRLMRLEGAALLAGVYLLNRTEHALVTGVILLVLAWNVWVTRRARWTLPTAITMALVFGDHLVPQRISDIETGWYGLAMTAVLSAFAWQLDRRTPAHSRVPTGVYAWGVAAATSVFQSVVFASQQHHALQSAIGLLLLGALIVVAGVSTRARIVSVLALPHVIVANYLLLVKLGGDVSHGVIAALFAGLAVLAFRSHSVWRIPLGTVAVALAILHLQRSLDTSYGIAVVIGLIAAWIVLSRGIFHYRAHAQQDDLTAYGWAAVALHAIALFGPLLDNPDSALTVIIISLVLVSLAATVSTVGALLQNRLVMLGGSAISMLALLLRISAADPASMHAYTIPLAAYLLATGLVMRRDARVANTLLASGSAMLVVPAMIEALTTGSMTWLWIGLAESLGLFFLGVMLRLRIPTAAGVIAVTVIALRMLVFAINALSSWVGVLAIGVALLAIGTAWMMYRDALTARLNAVMDRWRSYS